MLSLFCLTQRSKGQKRNDFDMLKKTCLLILLEKVLDDRLFKKITLNCFIISLKKN